MEKIVANGDRDCTIVLDGTECSVKFDRCFLAYSVQNNSTSDVFVSIHQGANAGDDGVVRIKAGSSGVYAHMRTEVKTIYFNGTGEIQVHGQNDTNNSFRNAPVSGGGGTTVDSYSKTESDARYAQKTDIPSSLPANGGNADTVGGKHADNFFNNVSTQITPESSGKSTLNEYLWSMSSATAAVFASGFPDLPSTDWIYNIQISKAGGAAYAIAYKALSHNQIFIRSCLSSGEWNGEWQEISTTPIKSTTFAGTTNVNGNLMLWAASENKIPICAVLTGYCSSIFHYAPDGKYYLGVSDIATQAYSPNVSVSGTVYYIEQG